MSSLSDLAKRKPADAKSPGAAAADDQASTTTALVSSPALSLSALSEIIAADQANSAPQFPVLTVPGGATGGMFTPGNGTPDDVLAKLPQGRQPVEGVFMGVRTELAAWPSGYDERQGENVTPAWSLAAAANDRDTMMLILPAAKNYNYTVKPNKVIFDITASGIGHIRPVLQLLIWSNTLKDLVIVESSPSYESWLEGLRSLEHLADKATGNIGQVPVSVRIKSEDRKSKSGQAWKVHMFSVDVLANAAGASMLATAKQWRESLPAERVEEVQNWLSGADRPINDDIRAKLVKAATLR